MLFGKSFKGAVDITKVRHKTFRRMHRAQKEEG